MYINTALFGNLMTYVYNIKQYDLFKIFIDYLKGKKIKYDDKLNLHHYILELLGDIISYDLSYLLLPRINIGVYDLIIEGVKGGYDVSWLANPYFNVDQAKVILDGLKMGIDVSIYAHPGIPDIKMKLIYLGLTGGVLPNGKIYGFQYSYGIGKKVIDVSWYADPKYSPDQMRMIIDGLRLDLDVSIYAKPEFNGFQMEEIFLGLIQKIDVNQYLDPNIPYQEMREIRQKLFNERKRKEKWFPEWQYYYVE